MHLQFRAVAEVRHVNGRRYFVFHTLPGLSLWQRTFERDFWGEAPGWDNGHSINAKRWTSTLWLIVFALLWTGIVEKFIKKFEFLRPSSSYRLPFITRCSLLIDLRPLEVQFCSLLTSFLCKVNIEQSALWNSSLFELNNRFLHEIIAWKLCNITKVFRWNGSHLTTEKPDYFVNFEEITLTTGFYWLSMDSNDIFSSKCFWKLLICFQNHFGKEKPLKKLDHIESFQVDSCEFILS